MSLVNKATARTGIASADLSAKQFLFVYKSGEATNKDHQISVAGDSQNVATALVYVLDNAPASGQEARCLEMGKGNSYLKVDGAYSAGALLMIGATGKGTALAGATKYARARVISPSTADGDVIEVELLNPTIAGS